MVAPDFFNGELEMLIAHLACKTITLDDSSFCPMCGKRLTEKNTMPVNMDNPAITEEFVEALSDGRSSGSYEDIRDIS